MSTIAYFAPVYRGHVVGKKNFINTLSSKGHKIIYFAPSDYMDLVMGMDASYIPYPEFNSFLLLKNGKLSTGDVNSRINFLLTNTVNASLDISEWANGLLDIMKVDLIIHDNMALWGYLSAEKLGINSICSLTIMPTNSETMKNTGEGSIYLNLLPESSESLKTLHDSSSAQDIRSFVDVMTCEYHPNKITYTSKLFQRHSEFFSQEDYMFFPSRCDNVELYTSPSDSIENIYISFGTIYNNDIDLYKNLLDRLLDTQYKVLVSVGGSNSTYSAINYYSGYRNINIEYFVNQHDALKSHDLFITHGGLNSVSESICHLVPMITIPLVGDQYSIAQSLQELGAGITMSRGQNDIIQQIEKITQSQHGYQDNLMDIRNSFTDTSFSDNTIERVEVLAEGRVKMNDEL
jgi:MGT family glycosyltransferase